MCRDVYCAELISSYAIGIVLYFYSWWFFMDFRVVKSLWLNCRDVFWFELQDIDVELED
jgi:hypothetical protein